MRVATAFALVLGGMTSWHIFCNLYVLNLTEDEKTSSKDEVVLKRSLGRVEYDVLHMDVKGALNKLGGSPGDGYLAENRLVHKLQYGMTMQYDEEHKCVIRIGKYCGKRCDRILWNYEDDPGSWSRFSCSFAEPCVVETRFISTDSLTRTLMKSLDVLIIVDSLHEDLRLEWLMSARPPGQLWVLYSRESPQHDPEYAPPPGVENPYNLSMTYSSDADIHFPYCHFEEGRAAVSPSPPLSPLPKKTKLMAWMASNCHRLSWRRGEFVAELQKYFEIDTYGRCGKLGKLVGLSTTETLQQYKFYLALENSECSGYITEKIWRTCLQNGIVPIVYGSKREDYEQLLPRNSFIHVEDFRTMDDLVDFIYELDEDDERYYRYFDWRSEGEIVCLSARFFIMYNPGVNMCYLLRKLVHTYVYPETSWRWRVPFFGAWWEGQCEDPTLKRNLLGFDVHRPRVRKKPPR